jgi:hypothetical protein
VALVIAPRRWSRPATLLLGAALTALAIAGCGGSGVKPSAYVRSVCLALGNWRNTIQSAGVALESSGAASASRPVAKLDYERFVSSLVTATRRATKALRAAGTPSVSGGTRIAASLTHGFDRATRGLERASGQARAIGTDTATAFQLGTSAVNAQIHTALEQIANVSPGKSPQLRTAAGREPACQTLAG